MSRDLQTLQNYVFVRRTYLGDGKQPLYEPKLFIVPSSDSVARSLLEEKEMENLAKNETIKVSMYYRQAQQFSQESIGRQGPR